MSTTKETMEFMLQKLGSKKFTARKMFGEYALYADGKVVALVCDNTLFVKITPQSSELEDVCEKGPPYPGAKDYYVVEESQLSIMRELPIILFAIAKGLPEKKVKVKTMKKTHKGFTLVELLVSIAIIGLLASVVLVATSSARTKARDVKRKQDLTMIGRFVMSSNCYMPDAGAGDYDLRQLEAEIRAKYPQASAVSLPVDPKSGNSTTANYRYQVTADNHCILYGNLDNEDEKIDLSITAPTAGAGVGTLRSATEGPNGTHVYYQIGR